MEFIFLFIFAALLILDIQLFMIYRFKIERFEKTKDESFLTKAKRIFAGAACSVIVTLAFMAFMAARLFESILSF